VLGGLLTALYLMVRYEPDFYRQKEIQSGPLRAQQSKEFEGKLYPFVTAISQGHDYWQETFTEAQINSYLQEDFIQSGVAGTMPIKGVSDPRISIEDDILRLGFRYGESPWSTIVNLDFRLWQAPKETNTVALQLVRLRAGLVPLSSKFLMHRVTRLLQSQVKDVEVSWYRHEGHLVALLRFSASRPRPTTQLKQLKVGQDRIIISGRSPNAPPPKIEVPVSPGG
jgi:hypothetical protein